MTGLWTRGTTRRDSLTRRLTRSSTTRTGTTARGKHTRNSTEVSTVNLFTVRQWSSEKVMFSVLSVCPPEGCPRMTITDNALDLDVTVQGALWPWTSHMGLSFKASDIEPPCPLDIRHETAASQAPAPAPALPC